MDTFRTRLSEASALRGRTVLACDYAPSVKKPVSRAIRDIKRLHRYVCAVKLNLHLLLPLDASDIRAITDSAHHHGLQVISDIKLNDIPNTNRIAAHWLWRMGFDAVIVNPIMGPDALARLTESAHEKGRGVISLCHMSAPEARPSYEMNLRSRRQAYQLFLEWAVASHADGIIVGATFPDIIRRCAARAAGALDILSPGVGTQGGDPGGVIGSGADYIIVGRTILDSGSPVRTARSLQSYRPE